MLVDIKLNSHGALQSMAVWSENSLLQLDPCTHLFDVHEFVNETDHGLLLRLSDSHLRVVLHLTVQVGIHQCLVVSIKKKNKRRSVLIP